MIVCSRAALAGALSLAVCSPVRADDVAKLRAALGSAAAGVTSFVVEMQVTGTTGVSGTMTFVRPLRVKSEFKLGENSAETYVVDGIMYIHSPAGGWQKMPLDTLHAPQQSLNIADTLRTARVTALADRQENGMTVGVIQVDAGLPIAPGAGAALPPTAAHIVCSYDKSSYRMSVCANSFMTMTYLKYNDPSNIVELPADAANATPVQPPVAAGTAKDPPGGGAAGASSSSASSSGTAPAPSVTPAVPAGIQASPQP